MAGMISNNISIINLKKELVKYTGFMIQYLLFFKYRNFVMDKNTDTKKLKELLETKRARGLTPEEIQVASTTKKADINWDDIDLTSAITKLLKFD